MNKAEQQTKVVLGLNITMRLEITGNLNLKVSDPTDARVCCDSGVSGEVKLKDPARAFPIGQTLGVLKWDPPVQRSTAGRRPLEMELENKGLELQDVVISIPLPSGAYPTVSSHTGSWAINPNTHSLDWTTETVSADAETTGSLEFSVGGDDAEAFFPVKVNFKSENSLIGVEVLSAERVGGEGSVVFSKEMRVGVEQHLIV
ncbi:hypothetical protein BDV93DRAFT_508948 [Ceratobasidium sp. AG-I]|nr:hypothetical protein BDV93DRAFT_508948 [Ceratobasidium sp. AG-I]